MDALFLIKTVRLFTELIIMTRRPEAMKFISWISREMFFSLYLEGYVHVISKHVYMISLIILKNTLLSQRLINVLFLQSLQKLFLFRQWKGYKSDGLKLKTQEPYFQVKRRSEIFEGDLSCQITVRSSDAQESCSYKLEALSGKLAFKITNSNGEIVAEVCF
jgi:hypothetical protein